MKSPQSIVDSPQQQHVILSEVEGTATDYYTPFINEIEGTAFERLREGYEEYINEANNTLLRMGITPIK